MGDAPSSSARFEFDLTSQEGVMLALYAVRTSPISAAERNELRDKIFLFTKSGGDESQKGLLEEKLRELPLSEAFLESQKAPEAEAVTSGFARGRSVPRFSVSKDIQTPAPTADKTIEETQASQPDASSIVSEETKTVSQLPDSTDTETQLPEEKVIPTAVEHSAEESSKPEVPVAEKPVAENMAPPIDTVNDTAPTPSDVDTRLEAKEELEIKAPEAPQVTEPEVESPAQVEVEANVPVAASVDVPTDTAFTLERIREIKRLVNESVGNPVNLVDIDNQVGRAYMAALLAAMQSVNGETGRAGTAEMQKLEAVFKDVQNLLQNKSHSGTSTQVESKVPEDQAAPLATDSQVDEVDNHASGIPDPVAEPVQQPEPQPVSAAQPKTATEPQSEINTTSNQSVDSDNTSDESSDLIDVTPHSITGDADVTDGQQSEVSKEVEWQPEPLTDTSNDTGASLDTSPVLEIEETDNNVEQFPGSVKGSVGTHPLSAAAESKVSEAPSVSNSAAQGNGVKTHSVAEELDHSIDSQLKSLDAKAAAQNAYTGDPLHAPEVDRGLQQLLMEWSLFKSSGLFGTGPNGVEHPLFKKLAPVMINDILLSKFEGARPEIIQSITDYMNGWRYEQGIVYTSGETFETYLRRVIRFIIDSKK